MRHRFALFRQLQPQLPARLCLTRERLRNRRRTAHLTENQDLHLKVATVVLYLQQIAKADLARSLCLLSVGLNPAEFTGPCSERARLEESGSPEPLIHSYAGHNPILIPGRDLQAALCVLPNCRIAMADWSFLIRVGVVRTSGPTNNSSGIREARRRARPITPS